MTSVAEFCKPFSDAFSAAVESIRELRLLASAHLVGKKVIGANQRPGVITNVEMDPTQDDLMLTITWDDFAANTNMPKSYVSPKHELYTMTSVQIEDV